MITDLSETLVGGAIELTLKLCNVIFSTSVYDLKTGSTAVFKKLETGSVSYLSSVIFSIV